jgi:hypothetical protein
LDGRAYRCDTKVLKNVTVAYLSWGDSWRTCTWQASGEIQGLLCVGAAMQSYRGVELLLRLLLGEGMSVCKIGWLHLAEPAVSVRCMGQWYR